MSMPSKHLSLLSLSHGKHLALLSPSHINSQLTVQPLQKCGSITNTI